MIKKKLLYTAYNYKNNTINLIEIQSRKFAKIKLLVGVGMKYQCHDYIDGKHSEIAQGIFILNQTITISNYKI